MVQTALNILQPFVVVVILPLLLLWMKTRVEGAAREGTQKALADYRHGHDQIMAAIGAGHQVRVHDLGLFAQRRNDVYGELFGLFERARGGYAGRFASLTETMDYSHALEIDLRHLTTTLERISPGERAELTNLLDARNLTEARKVANTLWLRDSYRGANQAFYEFKNSWVLNGLYISQAVSNVVLEAVDLFATLSVYASEVLEGDQPQVSNRRMLSEKVQQLDTVSANFRTTMRAEIFPEEAPSLAPEPAPE